MCSQTLLPSRKSPHLLGPTCSPPSPVWPVVKHQTRTERWPFGPSLPFQADPSWWKPPPHTPHLPGGSLPPTSPLYSAFLIMGKSVYLFAGIVSSPFGSLCPARGQAELAQCLLNDWTLEGTEVNKQGLDKKRQAQSTAD